MEALWVQDTAHFLLLQGAAMTSISLAFLSCHIIVVAFRNPVCGNFFARRAVFTGGLCVLLDDSSLPLAVWSEGWGWKSELSFGQALVWCSLHPFYVEGTRGI